MHKNEVNKFTKELKTIQSKLNKGEPTTFKEDAKLVEVMLKLLKEISKED